MKDKATIEEWLNYFGIEASAEDCDFCEDGSVWYGLTMIAPKGWFTPEEN